MISGFASCSGVTQTRIGIDAPSDSMDQFLPVSGFLDHRCGSLDCHGQPGRNLRIWGCDGMRLDPKDVPGCLPPGRGTTQEEDQATYRSLVGLEPTVMSVVVAGGGQHPELLTFVRKARGIETHKGGKLITPGDAQDICITSWLQGSTKTDQCATAVGIPSFSADASTE
jgi:hypothetical protein